MHWPTMMPATVTSDAAATAAGARAVPPRRPRRPFRDNPRLILAGIGVLVAALVAHPGAGQPHAALLAGFPDRVRPLRAVGRRPHDAGRRWCSCWRATSSSWSSSGGAALPFARFRAKLVALLLGMTLVPAVLVLIVGSELIRTNIDRWFNAPMDEILASANQIAGDYYHERQLLVSDHADAHRARAGARSISTSADVRPICAICWRRR